MESCDRIINNDEFELNFDKIKGDMDKDSDLKIAMYEKKLQETIELLESKNKQLFDQEVKLKEHQSEIRDKQRQYQKDLEVSVEKYNVKIKEMQAEIMNFNCKDRFEQVWEKKLYNEQMKRRDLSKIANKIISNLLLRIKDEKRINQTN